MRGFSGQAASSAGVHTAAASPPAPDLQALPACLSRAARPQNGATRGPCRGRPPQVQVGSVMASLTCFRSPSPGQPLITRLSGLAGSLLLSFDKSKYRDTGSFLGSLSHAQHGRSGDFLSGRPLRGPSHVTDGAESRAGSQDAPWDCRRVPTLLCSPTLSCLCASH